MPAAAAFLAVRASFPRPRSPLRAVLTSVGHLFPSVAAREPLPYAGISARAAPRHRASNLLTARADTQQRQPFELFRCRRQHPCQARRRPLPGWTRHVALPSIAFVGSVAAAAFPVGFIAAATFPACSAVPLVGSPSSWLDPSLPWPFRPDPPIPLLFCRGRGHPDRRSRVRCRWPPWRAPRRPDERRSKVSGLLLSFCVAPPTVDARTSTPLKNEAAVASLPTTATSTSATSASRGYRLLGVHTGLYSSRNIRTLTTLRLRGDFNPSAPTFGFYSSLIVCGAPVATAGGC